MHKNRGVRFLVLAACSVFIGSAYALDERSYAVGRYWGVKPVEEIEKKRSHPKQTVQVFKPSAREVLSHVTQMIDEAKARAVLEPTFENVKNFMILKNKIGNMATQFSQVWQQVLLQNAQLDYSAYRPTNNQGIVAFNKQYQARIESVLSESAKHHGLLYFYRGNDYVAQLQAPIIVKLAKKYNFDILGVSVDGKLLPDFEKNTLDNGQIRKMGVQKVPALLTMHPSTGDYFPLSYSLLAERELEQRVFDVFSHFETWK